MAATRPAVKGPWTHRFLVHLFTVVLTLLIYWFLSFVLSDIGSWPGPDYQTFEEQRLDPKLTARSDDLTKKIRDTERQISDQKTRQGILRDSTANSQTTMNQLLEIQKLALERKMPLSAEEVAALAESEKSFLANQQKYQLLNDEIAKLNVQLEDLRADDRQLETELEIARKPIYAEFEAADQRHRLQMAGIKLAALTPLLIIAVILFLKLRGSVFAPLVYAFGIALMLKVMLVMHEYFPARYFKYILILVSLAVVLWILFSLLRMIASPKRDWLIKQFRESYEYYSCPICDFPIRRGPLKYLFWTRRSLKKLRVPPHSPEQPEQSYICPSCSTALFEECTACHGIRHTLLPACEKCGHEKPLSELTANF